MNAIEKNNCVYANSYKNTFKLQVRRTLCCLFVTMLWKNCNLVKDGRNIMNKFKQKF